MKMQILRNSKGDIIAAFERTPGALVSVEAEPEVGDRLEELELSDECRSDQTPLDLDSLKRHFDSKRAE